MSYRLIVKQTVLLVLVYLFYTNHREYKPHRVTLFVYQFVTYKGGFTRRYWIVLAAKQKVTVRGQQRSCTVLYVAAQSQGSLQSPSRGHISNTALQRRPWALALLQDLSGLGKFYVQFVRFCRIESTKLN